MRFIGALLALPLALAAPVTSLAKDAEVIPGRFIAVMKQDAVMANAMSRVMELLGGSELHHKYDMGSFRGFAFSGADSLVQSIANMAEIAYIEPDRVVRVNALTTQQNAPYGLARISHRKPGTSEYTYDDSAGAGTFIYGIDTGIRITHEDFGGRASFGQNFAGDGMDTDGNGHGTHTAATAGGTTYGVAKKASVIAVKVLGADGSGANSQVIAGIQWAANDVVSKKRAGKAVGNLSLGGLRLGEATNQAAAAAVQKGLFLAVAAGNSMQPAVLSSPASEPTVCTVAASDKNDQFASFSNFGALVDVIAPGVDVISAWNTNDQATMTISGTSMAAPHVAGLGAYLLGLEGSRTPVALCDRIKTLSTKGAVTGLGTLLFTPNNLAFNGATA